MTLLSVVKDVCATVGVALPQSVFSNLTGNRTMQEMLALANEMAQRIAYDTRDWRALITSSTMTGSAGVLVPETGTMTFAVPANYKRMTLTANLRKKSSPQYPLTFIPDVDEWNERRMNARSGPYGEWILFGAQLRVYPPVAASDIIIFPYLDKNCINLASGGRGDRFMADTDSFTLDERVLKLAMIWQWKAQKGSPYAEDMGTYGDALTMAMGHDSPAPIILGRHPISASARVAYPWALPT